jgi:hypothetical protein
MSQNPNSFGSYTPESEESKKTQNSPNRKGTIIISSVVVAVLLVVGGVSLYLNQVSDSADSQSEEDMSMSSSSVAVIDGDRSNPSLDTDGNPTGITIPNREDPIDNLPEEEATQVEERRQEYYSYADAVSEVPQASTVQFVENTTTPSSEDVQQLKQELISEIGVEAAPTIELDEQSRKLRIEVEYTSIGDEDFTDGTLWVKVSDGLDLIPGTIKERTASGEEIAIADELFDTETNLLKYGPGTGDEDSAPVSVGQRGTIIFDVEVADDSQSAFGIISYLKDVDGEIGRPGNLFIEL